VEEALKKFVQVWETHRERLRWSLPHEPWSWEKVEILWE
jgi:hypothetical protein